MTQSDASFRKVGTVRSKRTEARGRETKEEATAPSSHQAVQP